MTPTSPTIVFAGGGSAGHVTPGIAVAEALSAKHPLRPIFLCSPREDEQALIKAAGFEYRILSAPKFPRGFSLSLITFPFLFPISLFQSFKILRELRPSLVFSKGGFVSVPVCIAAHFLSVTIVLHCSDSVPSMSDKLIGTMAKKICTGFPPTTFPGSLRSNAVQTGNPVRALIARGSLAAGQRITGFSGRKPVLMIIGGSQGSLAINTAINESFDALISLTDIIHLTGSGKGLQRHHARYFAKASVTEELPHLYALSDLVITRAGAGVLSELAVLKKAAVVIPLRGVAHDHQWRNAEALSRLGGVEVLPQERLSELCETVSLLLADKKRRMALGEALHSALPTEAASKVTKIILDALPEPL